MCSIALKYNGSPIRNNAVTHLCPKNILELKNLKQFVSWSARAVIQWNSSHPKLSKTIGATNQCDPKLSKTMGATKQWARSFWRPHKLIIILLEPKSFCCCCHLLLLLLLPGAFAVVVTWCFCTSWRCYYSRMLFLYIIKKGRH